jgi:hypothetical protein
MLEQDGCEWLTHRGVRDYEIDGVSTISCDYRCFRISRIVAAAGVCGSSRTRTRTRADKKISEICQRSRCACRPLGWARPAAKACMDVPSQSPPPGLADSTTATTSESSSDPHSLIILAANISLDHRTVRFICPAAVGVGQESDGPGSAGILPASAHAENPEEEAGKDA